MGTLKKVGKYSVKWNTNTKKGTIVLYPTTSTGGVWQYIASMTFDSVTETAAIAGILRNEKPIYWDTTQKILRTMLEETGEEET